ncbi:MAG TPA: hypothetical protein VGZ29_11835 [Terriglobia bacterium]|nr:hypothetical protein [Terriglobia bacterium]
MDTKTTDTAIPTLDVQFIYVDLQNSDDWEKIEMILTEAQFPVGTPGEGTPARGAGRQKDQKHRKQ